jgi:curved DNA-binding protein
MEFKDYYATLGVPKDATPEVVKRAFRKLARKYHPDVSKEPDAEARFKEVAEAYEALGDAEKRAAYDEAAARPRRGPEFSPPPGSAYEFSGRGGLGEDTDFSEFFSSIFGRASGGARRGRDPFAGAGAEGSYESPGSRDHHARIEIDLVDSYRGARRTIGLRVPVHDANGRVHFEERQLDVNIPKGVRAGQHLRLAGQGAAGAAGAAGAPGDLYLEIEFRPDARYRVDGRDVHVVLPLAPWEAALGGAVPLDTPDGTFELTVPPGSTSGRSLRLKGKGLPGTPAGDLYADLSIVMPPLATPAAREAWTALAAACDGFDPRAEAAPAAGRPSAGRPE